MLNKLRNSRIVKCIVMLTGFFVVFDVFTITKLFALTSGPSQPEFTGFSNVTSNNLVNPFTGDFSYSIPMLEIGGIPLGLTYNAGVGMDEEASWVGLGWSFNPGSISRDVRGLPDDFNGENIISNINLKPNTTYGVTLGAELELFGLTNKKKSSDTIGSFNLGANWSFIYNNYTGFDVQSSISPSISSAISSKLPLSASLSTSIGSTSDGSVSDISISPQITFTRNATRAEENGKNNTSLGLTFNSRKGFQGLTLSSNYSETRTSATDVSFKYQATSGNMSRSSTVLPPNRTYKPSNTNDFTNNSFTFNGKLGITAFGLDGTASITGFMSNQKLEELQKKSSNPAFGYLYLREPGNENLLDFNREQDGSLEPTTKNLAPGFLTYDVYSVSGPGMSGVFRPYRNEVGYISDPVSEFHSTSGSAGLEFAGGWAVSPGVDVSVTKVTSNSGAWTEQNAVDDYTHYNSAYEINKFRERSYFAFVGDNGAENNEEVVNLFGKKGVTSFELAVDEKNASLKSNFLNVENSNKYFDGPIIRENRVARKNEITYLTKKQISDYKPYRQPYLSTSALDHHIAEITVTSVDGTRYIYGLATYNTEQKEVTFSVGRAKHSDPKIETDANGFVLYNSEQNSPNNETGLDWYYQSTETPAYATAYLLTEVLSPDYVDRSNNGPSPDDLGTYVKYVYGEFDEVTNSYTANIKTYKWRTPLPLNKAAYNEGIFNNASDDKGNYTYGVKEVWYISSIETKDQLVEFYTSERLDGMGVIGENGEVGGEHLQKLDLLSLFSLIDVQRGNAYGYDAVPIKTVHLEYDYSLCKNVLNNLSAGSDNGKLALKKVYFTFNGSRKARFNPFSFEYSNCNPDYDIQAYNRWGTFKPNNDGGSLQDQNKYFPYVDQNTIDSSNVWASAWNIVAINLPSGGRISIEYESDDYAYVQDKPAAQMFKVLGATDNITNEFKSILYAKDTIRNCIIFDLGENYFIPDSYNTTQANSIIRTNFITGSKGDFNGYNGIINNLYFNFYLNSNDRLGDEAAFEMINGYAYIDNTISNYAGVLPAEDGYYKKAFIKLKNDVLKDKDKSKYDVHPITKAGFQFTKENASYYISNQEPPGMADFESVMEALADLFTFGATDGLFNPNTYMVDKGFCKHFVPENSWIRLLNPDGHKLGGGHRVKSIKLYDNWNELTRNAEESTYYGTNYSYLNTDGTSAGVAAYEPSFGADENILRRPERYDSDETKKYQYIKYKIRPFGETFYPAPTVGYSRVTVSNIQWDNVYSTSTGSIVNEFYTAYDFPTIVNNSTIKLKEHKPDPVFSIFSLKVVNKYTASQGYVIELNDMHGKIKSVANLNNKGELISKTTYNYKHDPDNPKRLKNIVDVMDNKGKITDGEVGVTYDVVADFRQNFHSSLGTAAQYNTDAFLAAIIPVMTFTLFVNTDFSEQTVRTSTITKVVYRTGLIELVTMFDKGASITTNNEIYDAETGNVLMTSAPNEFGDRYFSTTIPAYWYYANMGPTYQNSKFKFSDGFEDVFNWSTGKLTTDFNEYFAPGDEVAIKTYYDAAGTVALNNIYCWVYQTSAGDKYFIDQFGNPPIIEGAYVTGMVFRSGYKNLSNQGGMQLVTRKKPVRGDSLYVDETYKVISASASTYSDVWQTFCNYDEGEETIDCICNSLPTPEADDLAQVISGLIDNSSFYDGGNYLLHDGGDYVNNFTPELGEFLVNNDCGINMLLPDKIFFKRSMVDVANNQIKLELFKTSDNFHTSISCCGNTNIYFDGIDTTEVRSLLENDKIYSVTHRVYNNAADPCSSADTLELNICYPTDYDEGTETYSDYFDTITAFVTSSCFDLMYCYEQVLPGAFCTGTDGDQVNPYTLGILGSWKPLSTYAYLTNRTPKSGVDPDIRRDGGYKKFSPFYTYNGFTWVVDQEDWQWTEKAMLKSPYTDLVESQNALFIPSAVNFGYSYLLPEISAVNAHYQEIGFESFETDEGFSIYDKPCNVQHFNWEIAPGYLVRKFAHTGSFSLALSEEDSILFTTDLSSLLRTRNTFEMPFNLEDTVDCLPPFAPIKHASTDVEYLLTYWVKRDIGPQKFDFADNVDLSVLLGPTELSIISQKSSGIIEGWQRVEYKFNIPAGSVGSLTIKVNNTGRSALYVDDIKIQPALAVAKAFVYDYRTHWLMAELDENHFATFYEYDEEGQLVRVKKETERGILTVQENRKFIKKVE
ncbi:MAG: hypothetical protein V9F05_14410 [Chitinophagaceae bacterium]